MSENSSPRIGLAVYQILSDFDSIRRRILKDSPIADQKKLYGLTLRQSSAVNQVMLLTDKNPEGVTLKKLAEQLEMQSSAASVMVEKMVAKGFLERTENQRDRRTVNIRISEKGREVINNSRKLLVQKMEKFAFVLTDEEQKMLEEVAAKLKAAVRSAGA